MGTEATNNMNKLIFLIVLISFNACKQNSAHPFPLNKTINGKREGKCVILYGNDSIKSLLNYQNDSLNGESIYFYPNGNIRSKVRFTNDLENGMAYYFYTSGVLECYRQWENGRKIGYAQDYYDTIGYLKAYMYYNNKGELLWRNTVDINGNIVKREGIKK